MSTGSVKVYWLLLIVFLINMAQSKGAKPIVLKDGRESYAVSYPMFLIDNSQNLTAEQILNDTGFKQAKLPMLSLGATVAAVWIKTSIVNHTKKTDWYFHIDNPPVLQSVEVYQKVSGALVQIFSTRADMPRGNNQVRVNNLLIPLSVSAGTETEYYIRATSNNILRLPVKVLTLQKAFERSQLSDLLNGVTFGMLIAFIIYNFFVYILTREQTYIYYVFYIFLWSLNLFFYNGFIPGMLTSFIWLNSGGLIIGMASLLSILFTNSFLQTRKNSPFFFKMSKLMGILSIVVILIDIFWRGAYSFILVQYLMYPFFIYWFGAGIINLKNGYKPALYFVLGFGCLITGNAIYNLKDLDIIPDNMFTRTSMHWGTIMETLVLSFALASRLNFYRKEKEKIRLRSIKEKRNFLKELLQRQEQEKKRVAMELHDNIGQQLILIKNKSWRLQQLSRDAIKNDVSKSIAHIGEIISGVRGILHRLRPYQIDLLGLTKSIHGLMADVFANYDLETRSSDNIDPVFDADEAIHVFRVIQLLADNIVANAEPVKVSYALVSPVAGISFEFNIESKRQMIGDISDINNRLELLGGTISVQSGPSTIAIHVNIPRTGKTRAT